METKTVEANGLKFAYLEQGTGPLVLLVHGFPDTAHTWRDVMPAIAEAGFRAVAPFTRGYKPTEIPKDGDRRTFTVLVTYEDGHPVYSATLNYTGLWLLR